MTEHLLMDPKYKKTRKGSKNDSSSIKNKKIKASIKGLSSSKSGISSQS
jgi:hypothetical protein